MSRTQAKTATKGPTFVDPSQKLSEFALQRIEGEKAMRLAITKEMTKKRDHLINILPKWLSAEQLLNMVLQATLRNPELLECLAVSFVNAAFRAAEIGLVPNGTDGYLVPRFNKHLGAKEAQFMPSYVGLLELAFRSGLMTKAQARMIYKNEPHAIKYGIQDDIEHTPILDVKLRGAWIAVYAFVKFANGEHKFDVMLPEDIQSIKARSESACAGVGPWITDFEEMSKKTVFRRLLKTCRRSRAELGTNSEALLQLDRAIELDNEDYDLDKGSEKRITRAESLTKSKAADLRARLDARKESRSAQTITPQTIDVQPEPVVETSPVTKPVVETGSPDGLTQNGLTQELSEKYIRATAEAHAKKVRAEKIDPFKTLSVQRIVSLLEAGSIQVHADDHTAAAESFLQFYKEALGVVPKPATGEMKGASRVKAGPIYRFKKK